MIKLPPASGEIRASGGKSSLAHFSLCGGGQLAGGQDTAILDTLAAAYAEAGRFGDAVRTAQIAIELTKGTGQAEATLRIEARRQLYQAGRPYHAGLTSEAIIHRQ